MMLHRHFEEKPEERRKNLTMSENTKPKEEFVSEVFPPDEPLKKTRKKREE